MIMMIRLMMVLAYIYVLAMLMVMMLHYINPAIMMIRLH